MSRRHIEDRVRQTAWPVPSPGLRDRVLSDAVVAEQRITWSDRMWFSRAWRLAAVAVVLAVVVLDRLSGPPPSPGVTASAQALGEAQAIADAGRQMGLPPDFAASLAQRALIETARPEVPAQLQPEWLEMFERDGSGGNR